MRGARPDTDTSRGMVRFEPMTAEPLPPADPRGSLPPSRHRLPLSPVDPATWRAVLAIGLGFFVAIAAVSVVTTLFSMGGSLLIVLVGFVFVAAGIEAARIVAKVERWRMTLIDRRPLYAHPYRIAEVAPSEPYGPWLRRLSEAAFLDTSRWLDVAYVLVSFPLAMIEFFVAVTLWTLSAALLLTPLVLVLPPVARVDEFFARVGVAPEAAVGVAFVIGLVLLPVAASATRGMAILHRYVVEGLFASARRTRSGATTSASGAAVPRPSSSRHPSCAASSATSTTAPSSDWSCSPSTCPWQRTRWIRTRRLPRPSSQAPATRPGRRWASSGMSSAAWRRPFSWTAGWRRP